MITFHYKRLVMGEPSWQALLSALPHVGYAPGMERGFSIGVADHKEIRGRFAYKHRQILHEYDEETLTEKPLDKCRMIESRQVVPFALDFSRNLVRVSSARDFQVLYEALDALPGVHLDTEPFEVDLEKLHEAFSSHFKRTALRGIGLKDLLHDNTLHASTANCELLIEEDRFKTVSRYSGQLTALSFVVAFPDGKMPVRVTRAGGVSWGDLADSDALLRVMEDLILEYHDPAVEIVASDLPISPEASSKAGNKTANKKGKK